MPNPDFSMTNGVKNKKYKSGCSCHCFLKAKRCFIPPYIKRQHRGVDCNEYDYIKLERNLTFSLMTAMRGYS